MSDSTTTKVLRIPLSPQQQVFSISLLGVEYQLTFKYLNVTRGGWIMDIADGQSVPIVAGIPLVTGTDLLAGLEYLGIGGYLFMFSNSADPFTTPLYGDLGVTCNLYFMPYP